MGQGFGVAQGFAIAGRTAPRFDSYCMSGDGELQEGPIWEAVMYAGSKKLDNLCLLVDRNYGQLDLANRMIFPMPELEPVFASFGWNAVTVDATQYDGIYTALEQFRYGPRNGKPTAIICHATKGHGALSDFLNKHKVTVADKLMEQELELQAAQRRDRVEEVVAAVHADAPVERRQPPRIHDVHRFGDFHGMPQLVSEQGDHVRRTAALRELDPHVAEPVRRRLDGEPPFEGGRQARHFLDVDDQIAHFETPHQRRERGGLLEAALEHPRDGGLCRANVAVRGLENGGLGDRAQVGRQADGQRHRPRGE